MPWTHSNSIFAKDFKPKPYWWEAFQPSIRPVVDLPISMPVVVAGAGYTGLNAALELSIRWLVGQMVLRKVDKNRAHNTHCNFANALL